MQVVILETAKRLKDAGFPQPSDIMHPYEKNKWCMFYVEPSEEGDMPELYSLDRIDDILTFGDPCEIIAYAPTAIELLPEDWLLMRDGDGWICQHFADSEVYIRHENPAEAAAAAWLRENAK